MAQISEAQTTKEAPDGMTLVRRLNALMAERDEKVAEAGGWLTGTDPAWRADWRRRMDALLADVRAREADPR